MTPREKLIELLNQYRGCLYDREIDCNDCDYKDVEGCFDARLADYLIANGVVALPCRCKDCKYFDGEPGQPNIQCSQMHEDDFCSYGVRKGGK